MTDFFKSVPVRKQAALKHSSRYLAKIKRLLQAYALARPTKRFSLRVLKAKSDKSDWIYAPKADSTVEDAALKVVGRECAAQCDWTALELDGFEVQAFLPRADADPAAIANHGTFLAIDSRPVSVTRGTPQKISALFKQTVRKANRDLSSTKDPFMCMNIRCPVGSYDPNIEPAKDDVLFENGELVLSAVERLLTAFYLVILKEREPVRSAESPAATGEDSPCFPPRPSSLDPPPSSISFPETSTHSVPLFSLPSTVFALPEPDPDTSTAVRSAVHGWRSGMCDIDEEDMNSPHNYQPLVIEEEDKLLNTPRLSNPWTIAKMIAPVKHPKAATNTRLVTPVRRNGKILHSSSPISQNEDIEHALGLLTPQMSSPSHRFGLLSNSEPRDMLFEPTAVSQNSTASEEIDSEVPELGRDGQASIPDFGISTHCNRTNAGVKFSQGAPNVSHFSRFSTGPKKNTSRPFKPPTKEPDSSWYGFTPYKATQHRERTKPAPDRFKGSNEEAGTVESRDRIVSAAEALVQTRSSNQNRDIREFIPTKRLARAEGVQKMPAPQRSFIPVNPPNGTQRQVLSPSIIDGGVTDQSLAVQNLQSFADSQDSQLAIQNSVQSYRRTTTGNFSRTKSSKLPLERVPRGYKIQNLQLTVSTTLEKVIGSMQKLDMRQNILPWDMMAEEMARAFEVTVTPHRLKEWCYVVNCSIRKLYAEEDDIDTAKKMEELVNKALVGVQKEG